MSNKAIDLKETVIGLELGSTRIKAVLLDRNHIPIASGGYDWENHFVNGIWTYPLDEVHRGLQGCYADLKRDVKERLGLELDRVGAIGISGMMHGYLAFDKDGKQLAEFRTWRNTITGPAAEKLTERFGFNIPQRWSIAHYYQAMLNGEEHVKDVRRLFTLCAYIHWLLTGKHVIGIGEASGMFPIDSATLDYDERMVQSFKELTGISPRDVLPKVLVAGQDAGTLTAEGAALLDPAGTLQAGIPLAPPEGDAGTGMTATNAVRPRTGNVSAGTSDFAMIVTEHPLGVHREIDMVTTPDGAAVAMAHCNNCTSDINAWVDLFGQFAALMGMEVDKGTLFTRLFQCALEGDPDCGGLLSYHYLAGEGITDLDAGRPLFLRRPDAKFTLANFMRTHLLSSLATLKVGLDILAKEDVKIDRLCGHGGFFKTPGVGQMMLSAAVGAPVTVMETAGEGGPYGMALLAAYMLWKEDGESLPDYLDNKVFSQAKATELSAGAGDVAGFTRFLDSYMKALDVERRATEVF